MRVGISDFTAEELAPEGEAIMARVLKAFENGEATTYKPK